MEPLTESEAFDFLAKADVAHIAVIDMGEPYVTPMTFVVEGRRILFRSGPGRRLDALRRHPAVTLEACYLDHSTGDWVSVIATGDAEELTDDLTSALTVGLLTHKYSQILGTPVALSGLQPLPEIAHVIGIPIHRITGVTSRRGLLVRMPST